MNDSVSAPSTFFVSFRAIPSHQARFAQNRGSPNRVEQLAEFLFLLPTPEIIPETTSLIF